MQAELRQSRLVLGSAIAAIVVIAFAWAKLLQSDAMAIRSSWPKIEEYKIVPPPATAPIVYAWMGRQLAADVTWARALVYYGSATVGESDFRYLTKFLDNILVLDPKFRKVYDWAANAVAWKQERATVAEFETSVKYLEKAIAEFPEDWQLYQSLALRYAYDLQPRSAEERRANLSHAAELLERASRLPNARIQLATMAANLRSNLGERDRALAELRQMIMSTDNPDAQQRLMIRYRALLDNPAVDDEITAYRKDFNRGWKQAFSYAPPDYFVLLGPDPPQRVDLPAFAPIRDLLVVDLLGDQGEPAAPRAP